VAKVDRERRHRRDREELGLPVLQRAVPEVRCAKVVDPRDGRLAVRALLVVEHRPVRQRLREQRSEEDESIAIPNEFS
jgi:hypothetical protein